MYLPQPLLEMQKLKASDVESLAEIVPGWGHQISRHFRWCQVIWLVPRDFNCSNSSSIGKRVQAWLAHRVPVRLSNSSSIVNEQSSCACKVGNLSDGALLRTASLTSWILCWQSFRARCLDGFIDIGSFNFRFSTSSSQSPFYLQAAESAFVTYCESMWRTKGSPCPFRIEMTRTGERRKKEDMMVASQAEDPKLYVAHSRCQQHRLKI